jgi:hypothetical protein
MILYPFLKLDGFAKLGLNQQVIADEKHVLLHGDDYNPMEARECRTMGAYDESTPAHASDLTANQTLLDEDFYLAGIRQLAQFLKQEGLDMMREISHSWVFALFHDMERMTLPVLRECGLNRNYRALGVDAFASILYPGLCWCFHSVKRFHVDNLIDMISNGADIYDMEWAPGAWIEFTDGDGVMSPTVYAKGVHRIPIWRYALKQAGYDPDEVFLEDRRRRREFRKLHGVISSAIEMRDPPTSTLRRQIARVG